MLEPLVPTYLDTVAYCHLTFNVVEDLSVLLNSPCRLSPPPTPTPTPSHRMISRSKCTPSLHCCGCKQEIDGEHYAVESSHWRHVKLCVKCKNDADEFISRYPHKTDIEINGQLVSVEVNMNTKILNRLICTTQMVICNPKGQKVSTDNKNKRKRKKSASASPSTKSSQSPDIHHPKPSTKDYTQCLQHSQLEQTTKQHEDTLVKMEKLEGNNHHLHTQLSEQLNEQKKLVEGLKREKVDLHNSKVELNRELTRAAADVTRVTRDCTELHRQIKELKAKLENEKRERTLRKKEMGEMTASILRMTREKTELEASRDSTIRIEIQTLRGQNQDLSTSKDNLESEHHELQYNYRCLAGAFGDCQESHEKMSEENKSLKSALALANSDRYIHQDPSFIASVETNKSSSLHSKSCMLASLP